MGLTPSKQQYKISFALKDVNASRETTKSTCFEDFGLIIETWTNFGLDFKQNFDPDPLEIVPDPKTALKKY